MFHNFDFISHKIVILYLTIMTSVIVTLDLKMTL